MTLAGPAVVATTLLLSAGSRPQAAQAEAAPRHVEAAASAAAAAPDEQAIARALEAVRKDPNLGTETTITMLRWRDAAAPPKRPAWWSWIRDLFRWIDQSARYLVWAAAAALVGYLLFFLARLMAEGRDPVFGDATFVAPSHVRDLDIRPESLPADIGAAARALWDRGERRPALALLYRGMLSRFAHVHQVPIRDSSTEGDCLMLAAAHLPAAPVEYATRLVREWQRGVYGRERAETETIHGLCDGFAPALDRRAPADAIGATS
jgi:hypothetical protein